MPGELLHVGLTAMCPHGGQVSVTASSQRVTVGGQAVVTTADTFTVSGCAFTVPPSKPQPCTKVQWLVGASRVLVGGQPAVLKTSTGLCQSADQIPAGPPSISQTQTRVTGT